MPNYQETSLQKFSNKQYHEAIPDFDRHLFEHPGDALTYRYRGEAQRALGRYDKALTDFNASLEKVPNDAFVLACRGDANWRLGKYKYRNDGVT